MAARCCSCIPEARSGPSATTARGRSRRASTRTTKILGRPRAASSRRSSARRSPRDAELRDLGEVKQKNGKVVIAYAAEGDLDASAAHSNTFEMEWPPRSGRRQEFPEIDRAEWFALARAREKLLPAQAAFVDRLEEAGAG